MTGFKIYVFKKDNCPPCEAVQPTIDMLMEEFDEFQWKTVNISTSEGQILANRYSITKTPTLLVVDSVSGKAISIVEGTNEQKLFAALRYAKSKLKPTVEIDF
jgi:thiol-disulfide isomerase/thioredoxin